MFPLDIYNMSVNEKNDNSHFLTIIIIRIILLLFNFGGREADGYTDRLID